MHCPFCCFNIPVTKSESSFHDSQPQSLGLFSHFGAFESRSRETKQNKQKTQLFLCEMSACAGYSAFPMESIRHAQRDERDGRRGRGSASGSRILLLWGGTHECASVGKSLSDRSPGRLRPSLFFKKSNPSTRAAKCQYVSAPSPNVMLL